MKRYLSEGESGFEDRSSRPHNSPRATPPEKVAEIVTLRQEGGLTGDHIARKINMHHRTASRFSIRANLSLQKDVEPRVEDPPRRYEHDESGDMVHLGIKKLRNFKERGIRNSTTGNRHKSANKAAGSQYMHVAVDDHSRYAFEDETAESVTKHPIETYQQYAMQGIIIERVLTDNSSGYKSTMFAEASKTLNLKHVFT